MATKKTKEEVVEAVETTLPPPHQRVNEVGYLPPNTNTVNPSISIKEYFDSLIQEKEKRYEQRFTAQQEAVLKAEAATEKRFESVNEFRNTLKDQQLTFASKIEMNTALDYIGKNILKNQEDINDVRLKIQSFITSAEYGLRHTELQLQISAIRDIINTNQGKTTIADPVNDEKFNSIAKTLEALSMKIGSLQDTRSTESGATAKSSNTWAVIGAVAGIGISVVLLVLRLMGK